MNKTELQTVLGYVSVFLGIAHNMGVSLGHFGNDDFVDLASKTASVFYQAIAPAAPPAPATTTTS
jgi:hypothetical protein